MRVEGFFKRLKIYTESSSTTDFVEVLVNVVVEVLNILSIATKEMEQSRASGLFLRDKPITWPFIFYPKTDIKKLLGRADIEDALKRLDDLIREEHQAATAQVLMVTSELRDGALSYQLDSYTIKLNFVRLGANSANVTMQQIVNGVDEVHCTQSPITITPVVKVKSLSQGIRYNRTFVNGSPLRTRRQTITSRA